MWTPDRAAARRGKGVWPGKEEEIMETLDQYFQEVALILLSLATLVGAVVHIRLQRQVNRHQAAMGHMLTLFQQLHTNDIDLLRTIRLSLLASTPDTEDDMDLN